MALLATFYGSLDSSRILGYLHPTLSGNRCCDYLLKFQGFDVEYEDVLMKFFTMLLLQHDARSWYKDLLVGGIGCLWELQEIFRYHLEDANEDDDFFEDGVESII
jgi:hypothetical protein